MGRSERGALEIHRQRRFSQRADYAAFAAVRIHNAQLARLGGRNAWVYIKSGAHGVYRTIRGSGALSGFPQDGIEMDYDTCVDLGICTAEMPRLRGYEG